MSLRPGSLFFAVALSLAHAGCGSTGEEAGIANIVVQNDSDATLAYAYTAPKSLDPPEVRATAIPPSQRTTILRRGGCFGCADPPSRVITSLTLTAGGKTVRSLDPVTDAAFQTTRVGEYDANHVLVVTQAEVDAAK